MPVVSHITWSYIVYTHPVAMTTRVVGVPKQWSPVRSHHPSSHTLPPQVKLITRTMTGVSELMSKPLRFTLKKRTKVNSREIWIQRTVMMIPRIKAVTWRDAVATSPPPPTHTHTLPSASPLSTANCSLAVTDRANARGPVNYTLV